MALRSVPAFVVASLVLSACMTAELRAEPTAVDSSAEPAASVTARGSSAPGHRSTERHDGSPAAVVAVIDGDTFEVRVDGRTETVRLIGVNAPEQGECFSGEAADALADLVADRPVRLVADASDRDRFDRLLRYVFVDDVFVNESLVAGGYALARRYPPDVARADVLDAAQERARAGERGMWSPSGGCVSGASAALELSLEVEPDAPGDDNLNLNGEWLQIRNDGGRALDFSGWMVKDESATHRYEFPAGTSLPADGQLRLYSGCGSDSATELYWCATGSAIWNNSGDTAFLLDRSGKVVALSEY